MLEKLKTVSERYDEIEKLLSSGDLSGSDYQSIMKERSLIEPIALKYKEYVSVIDDISSAEEIIKTETDSELIELAKEELDSGRIKKESLEHELKILLLPKDEDDDKDVIIEIRAGAGGEEAALFAHSLFRMYSMYSERTGFKISILNENATELGGTKEITFKISGKQAYSKFKYESGVHRVQRVPETEAGGRIHTSTATVAVLPDLGDVSVEINDSDLKFETCKSSGAGGQHINKTESAVRITHIPTGIVVECQEERSQFKNRDKAMKMLYNKLHEIKRKERDDNIANERKTQVGTGDRSEKIRTYNYPQSRVTDHRIGYTSHNLLEILDGNLDELIDSLTEYDNAEKLKNSNLNS